MSPQNRVQFTTEPHEIFYLCPENHKAENKAARMLCFMRLWPKSSDVPTIAEEHDKENDVDSDYETEEILSIEAIRASLKRRQIRSACIARAVSNANKKRKHSSLHKSTIYHTIGDKRMRMAVKE